MFERIKKLKRHESENVQKWKTNLSWTLRILILISGTFQTLFGETAIGLMILAAWALIVFPELIFRKRKIKIPIEIELILFFMVILQLVIGEANNFYTNVPYYDKFVHFMLPLFMGIIGFLVVYTMFINGKLIATKTTMIVLIVLVALGIGALWEIVEYLSDEILYPRIPNWHHFQGSLTEDALHDTMNDLIMDVLGAFAGALLGVWMIGRAEKRNKKRLDELVAEVSKDLH